MSLTFDGRVATTAQRPTGEGVLDRIGLMCPMRIGDVTAFAGKDAWQPLDELKSAFSALLANVLASDLVSTLERSSRWATSEGLRAPTEAETADLLWNTWSDGVEIRHDYFSLETWITQQRTKLLQVVGIRDDAERRSAMATVVSQPLMRGSIGAVSDALARLSRWDAYATTRWHLLFDEVEFLEGWQKQVVYSFLTTTVSPISSKIATLPYAHRFALEAAEASLLEGADFDEIALALTAELEFRTDEEDDTSTDFAEVCRGIWRSRLETNGLAPIALEQVWPEPAWEDVVRPFGREGPLGQEQLTELLIQDLPEASQERARDMLVKDPSGFSDQYWRKYKQPFKFRLTQALDANGDRVPLYWGWKTLLRACDGNCRWFLQLADKCWQKYWSSSGIRPLTPLEQDRCLREWARSVHRRLQTSQCGRVLQEVVDRVISQFSSRLYSTVSLRAEGLIAQVSDLSDAQAEAVGFGVAHGYLVPRLSPSDGAQALAYPMRDVELRLGFPLAVDRRLPLRSGSSLKISDLRQVVMPWLKDASS